MSKCTRRRFAKQKICAGELRHIIAIQQRILGGGMIGDTGLNENFTTLFTERCAIETLNPDAKFDGVSTDDRPTHRFIVRKSSQTSSIEIDSNFILFQGRRFRILGSQINDEDPYYVIIRCTERGVDTKGASET